MSALPDGWHQAALAGLCDPVAKWNPRESPSAVFPYIDIGAIDGQRIARAKMISGSAAPSRARQLVRAGDTVLSTVRTYLKKTALIPDDLERATASTGFCVLRPGRALDAKYLFYRVTSDDFVASISTRQIGSSYPAVRDGDVFAETIEVPPLAEQRRIVAAIEEQFSRLDAAEADLVSARSRAGAFVSALVEAAVADFPVVELGSVAREIRYGTSTRCSYDAVGTPVLRIPNIIHGRIDSRDLKWAAPDVDLSRLLLQPGDILVVRTNGSRGLIGRIAPVTSEEEMAFASYLIRVRLDLSQADATFVALALSSVRARALIEARAATSAGQYNLNIAALRTLPLPLPRLDEQRRVVAEIDEQLSLSDSLCAAVESAQKRSAALRRAILERAFRGELVPQDPDDEPASVFLERICADHAATPKPTRRKRVSA